MLGLECTFCIIFDVFIFLRLLKLLFGRLAATVALDAVNFRLDETEKNGSFMVWLQKKLKNLLNQNLHNYNLIRCSPEKPF